MQGLLEKCGWRTQRQLTILATDGKINHKAIVGQESYRHINCAGRVVVEKVLGSHVLQ